MSDDGYGSIRAPEDAIERAREQKEAAGRTWGEQIVRAEAADADFSVTAGLKPVVDDDALAEAVEEVEAAMPDAGHIERLAELIERVPERTADELEGRFR